jgi:hypothetical protein
MEYIDKIKLEKKSVKKLDPLYIYIYIYMKPEENYDKKKNIQLLD